SLVMPGGPLALILGGLAVAGSYYAYQHWDDIKKWWNGTPETKGENGGIRARKMAVMEALGKLPGVFMDDMRQLGTTASKALGDWWANMKKSVQSWGTNLDNSIAGVMTPLANKFIAEIQKIPGMVMGAISQMASAIGAAISSAIASIGGMLSG